MEAQHLLVPESPEVLPPLRGCAGRRVRPARQLVVRGVMGGVVWVGGGGRRCRVWGPVMGFFLWRSREGGPTVVCVGGGIDINRLVGAAVRCVCGLVSGGGAGGGGVGVTLLVVGWAGLGVVLVGGLGSLWVVWLLRVCAVRSLRSLAGCGAEVWVRGGRMGVRVGLWSVCNEWLLVDGARWYGVWVGGLLVVVGRPYYALVLLVCVRGSPRVHGGVPWLVCRGPA